MHPWTVVLSVEFLLGENERSVALPRAQHPGTMIDVIHVIEGISQELQPPRVIRFERRHRMQSP